MFLCRFIHKWGKWKKYKKKEPFKYDTDPAELIQFRIRIYEVRYCLRCNKEQRVNLSTEIWNNQASFNKKGGV